MAMSLTPTLLATVTVLCLMLDVSTHRTEPEDSKIPRNSTNVVLPRNSSHSIQTQLHVFGWTTSHSLTSRETSMLSSSSNIDKNMITRLPNQNKSLQNYREKNVYKEKKILYEQFAARKENSPTRTIRNTNSACSCNRNACDCSDLNLENVPQDLPKTITELFLKNNTLNSLKSNELFRYKMLENLVLVYCFLDHLEDGAFNGLSKLIYLDLRINDIGYDDHLPERVFEALKSLKILRLDLNILTCTPDRFYPGRALSYLPSLEELSIDFYNQGDFGPEFRNMTSLRRLNIQCVDCHITSFSNETFQYLGHITSLDISSCNINGSTIQTGTFQQLTDILFLDISYNPGIGMKYFPVMMWGMRDSKLQTLRMSSIVSDYSITVVNYTIIKHLPKTLENLIARSNNIQFIYPEAVRHLPKGLKFIDVSGNDIIEDPNDIPLGELVKLETLYAGAIEYRYIECNMEYPGHIIVDTSIIENYTMTMDEGIRYNNYSNRERVINKVIPESLKRIRMNLDTLNYDFLSGINEPNSVEDIDLRCSFIPNFDLCQFIRLPNLKYLNLMGSSVKTLDNPCTDMTSMKVLVLASNMLNDYLTTFGGVFALLPNLTHLDLSFNELTSLRSDLFTGLDKLEYLRLDGNLFSKFGADISNMSNLRLLNLSYTQLSHLPISVRSHIDRLTRTLPEPISVDMKGCPIQCDCFNLEFLKWLTSSPAIDKNQTHYICKYPDTSMKYIMNGYEETIAVLDRECAKNYPMFLIFLAVTLVLLCAVIGAVIYR